MTRHIGWTIIVIAIAHTLTALALFRAPLAGIIDAGLVDTVRPPAMPTSCGAACERDLIATQRAFVIWFLYAGFAFALLGLLIRDMEARGIPPPTILGYGLLVIVGISGVVSPVSGVWLLLIPAIAILRAGRTS